MKIGIIGTGRMASGLGRRWANAGHEVFFGSREPAKARQLAAAIGANAQGGSQAQAVSFSDTLLLTTPWDATEATLRSLGSLAGKVVIETTNNFVDQHPVSTTERIMSWAPGVQVVKAFNTIFWQILHADPASAQSRPDVFIVGDAAAAKAVTAQWVAAAGFHAVDAGPASNAHHLENLAFFVIELAYSQQYGTDIGFQLVRV